MDPVTNNQLPLKAFLRLSQILASHIVVALLCISITVAAHGNGLQDPNPNLYFSQTVQPDDEIKPCQTIAPETLDAVVKIIVSDDGSDNQKESRQDLRHGSGVIIGENLIVSSAHTFRGLNNPLLRLHFVAQGPNFEKSIPADAITAPRIIRVDQQNDLVLIEANTHNIRPLPLAEKSPQFTAPIWPVGYVQMQPHLTLDESVRIDKGGSPEDEIHFSADIDHGQSGGALLICRQGAFQLAGIIRGFAAVKVGDKIEREPNHSVAVSIKWVKDLIQNHQE